MNNVFVTTDSDQIFGGIPITGSKTFLGNIEFGAATATTGSNAPLSFNTNAKLNSGGTSSSFAFKYANLSDADLVTKLVLNEYVDNFPVIDQGTF